MGRSVPAGTVRRPLCAPRPAGTPLYAALPSMKTAHSLRNAASYREICREVRRRQETARPPDSLQRARLWVQPHRIRSGTHRRERRTMRLPKQRGTAEQTVFRKAIKAVLPRRQGRRQRHRRQGPLCRAEMRKLPEGAAWVGHPQDGILMLTTVQMPVSERLVRKIILQVCRTVRLKLAEIRRISRLSIRIQRTLETMQCNAIQKHRRTMKRFPSGRVRRQTVRTGGRQRRIRQLPVRIRRQERHKQGRLLPAGTLQNRQKIRSRPAPVTVIRRKAQNLQTHTHLHRRQEMLRRCNPDGQRQIFCITSPVPSCA